MIDTLFGPTTIPSISYNDGQLINWILKLHSISGDIDLDPTYSIGSFYKHYGIKEPKYKFDLKPMRQDVLQADVCNLPLANESVSTIMFDPPFVIGGKPKEFDPANPDNMLITRRFSGFRSIKELKVMYAGALKQFYRILKPNGVVIFKCQDVAAEHYNFFTHNWLFNQAIALGFEVKDLFILLSKNKIIDNKPQYHARKYHCYYYVLKKSNTKQNYQLIFEEQMPDITKCGGEGCRKKSYCYRYTSPMSEFNQSWLSNPPFHIDDDGKFVCNDFWGKHKKEQLPLTFGEIKNDA